MKNLEVELEHEPKIVRTGNPVDHPDHYQGRHECIDVLRDVLGADGFQGFCIGNVIKYCWRYRKKNGTEDLKKAEWYLHKIIEERMNVELSE